MLVPDLERVANLDPKTAKTIKIRHMKDTAEKKQLIVRAILRRSECVRI